MDSISKNKSLNLQMKKIIQRGRIAHNFCSLKVLAFLFCLFTASNLFAQNSRVTGVVTDKNGEPVVGASIIVKNTTRGTLSNINGAFSLDASAQDILKISFIGYTTLEVKVDMGKRMNIILEESDNILDEIVVVGFGTQKKVNLTGAVSTVSSKTFESRPVSNTIQALQGAVPGLNVGNSSGGGVESKPTFNIRGMATIGDSSGDPLVLIDGMEGDIHSLNPQDIDNISFLKDAASASIYGSRAPFGVILITTKKGKAGKPRISYDGSFRSKSSINVPDIVDSYTFAQVFNQVPGGQVSFDDDWLQRIKDYQDGKITTVTIAREYDPQNRWASGYNGANNNMNVFNELYKSSSYVQEHNISVSGGSENVMYYLSGNYMDDDGLLKIGGDHQDRTGLSARINAKVNDKISITYGGRFVRSKYERPQNSSGWNAYTLSKGWPTMPVYDPNGHWFGDGERTSSMFLEIAESGRINNVEDRIYQQLEAVVEPIKDWKIIGSYNFSLKDNFKQTYRQQLSYHNTLGEVVTYDKNSYVTEDVDRRNYYNANVYSEYTKQIADAHNFKIMAGFQSELTRNRGSRIESYGILDPKLPTINTTSGLDENGELKAPDVQGGYYNFSSAGYFGRLNYDYKGRYLIEGNLRYDGSSRFRADKRWSWLPGVSLGWNVAQEAFWKNLQQYVGLFKLRGSYGVLGNQNTNLIYPTYSTLSIGSSSSSWLVNGARQNTSSYASLVSALLTWERISTYNAGVDLSLLNNRLTVSFDCFVRYTNDMVGPAVELPAVYGVPLTEIPRTNNTDLKTEGFELDIAWHDRLSNGLNYSTRFTLSDDQTTILKYPNPNNQIGYQNTWNGNITYDRYISGEKFGNIWGYTTIGIAQTQEEMDAHLATLPNGGQDMFTSGDDSSWDAGDIMYADLNSDGKVDAGAGTLDDPGDRSVIGNITPRFKFGIDLSADWKGFDLRIFFQGVMKRDYMNTSYLFWGVGRSLWDNSTVLTQHMDYFRDDPDDPFGLNLDAYYPRLTSPNNANATYQGKNRYAQTRYLQNAAYIRLKNLTLGYTLPQNLSNKAALQKVRIYVSGENLWTGTKLAKMFDPETIDYADVLPYPLVRTYSVGINIAL